MNKKTQGYIITVVMTLILFVMLYFGDEDYRNNFTDEGRATLQAKQNKLKTAFSYYFDFLFIPLTLEELNNKTGCQFTVISVPEIPENRFITNRTFVKDYADELLVLKQKGVIGIVNAKRSEKRKLIDRFAYIGQPVKSDSQCNNKTISKLHEEFGND